MQSFQWAAGFARALVLSFLATLPIYGHTQPVKKAAENRLLLAVSEGTSGGIDAAEALAKYRPLADMLGKAVGQPVVVTFVRNFDALEEGMKADEYDLVMARPSDFPARGVRDYGYSLLATSKPDGQCYFIVHKDSPLRKIEDAKGKQIIFPEKIAYMTKFCSAELRDRGFDLGKEQIKYAKEQGAVGWTVENKLVDMGGVASYSGVAKNWEKNGNRILHKAPPQPYFPIIASKRLSADKIARLQKALGGLESSEEGKKALATIGIKGYNVEDSKRLLALLDWLEKK
jgi:ABC-type phosphate/phosphonate transport system substrate-binding protein